MFQETIRIAEGLPTGEILKNSSTEINTDNNELEFTQQN